MFIYNLSIEKSTVDEYFSWNFEQIYINLILNISIFSIKNRN